MLTRNARYGPFVFNSTAESVKSYCSEVQQSIFNHMHLSFISLLWDMGSKFWSFIVPHFC